MDKDKEPSTLLNKWLSKEDVPKKKASKFQYMLLVLCIGAAFMLAGNILFKKQADVPVSASVNSSKSGGKSVPAFGMKKSSGNNGISDYEREYESQIKEALDEMLGVSDTKVVVNIDSTEEKVLQKNKVTKNSTTDETDTNGGTRKIQDDSVDEQLVIVHNGDKEVPVVVETKKPEIRGVLVIARGAQNIEIKKSIVEAVTRALGVPSYRVAVMPKK